MNQYLCILSGPRTGTTNLQRAIDSTGKFHNFSEIFHTAPYTPGSYLEFVQKQDLRIADLVTGEQARKVGLDYLAYVQSMADGKIPLLDVKINSWLALQPFWHFVHESPFFMRLLLEQQAIFLFVRRRDLVSQVLSAEIARSTGKWHELEDADVREKLKVGARNAVIQARLILLSESFFLNHLEKTDRILAIDYEDLYPDGFVSPGLVRELEGKFGIELPKDLAPPLKKNLGDKREMVANYDEVSSSIMAMLEKYPRRTPKKQIKG
jgi:LPS sulfotransferase NodH